VGADWHAIAREFRRACCGLAGQSAEPPLLVTINAGYLAMPTLLKLSRVLAAKVREGAGARRGLSLFVCLFVCLWVFFSVFV
jgi:hypothetical protein